MVATRADRGYRCGQESPRSVCRQECQRYVKLAECIAPDKTHFVGRR
jgi:hypothetical protein